MQLRIEPITSLAALLLLSACPDERPGPSQGYSRVAAVKTSAPEARPTSWCDVHHGASSAPALRLPPVEPAQGPDALAAGRPTWINLWATWCKPCLREMPLLGRFRDALAEEGLPVEIVFLSVDEDRNKLAAFIQAHPDAIPSPSRQLQLRDPAAGTGWLARYGLAQAATIPIQLLIDGRGRLRCLRAGSIQDGHFRTLQALLRAL